MEPLTKKMASRRAVAEINVVPYIDVMLVLLIIFMVTAPMLVQSVAVDLPEVDSKPTEIDPDDNTIIIAIDATGGLFIEREEDDPKALEQNEIVDYVRKIQKVDPSARVMIRGDQRVPYGVVVTLMGSLQGVGVNNVGLITEAPDPNNDG